MKPCKGVVGWKAEYLHTFENGILGKLLPFCRKKQIDPLIVVNDKLMAFYKEDEDLVGKKKTNIFVICCRSCTGEMPEGERGNKCRGCLNVGRKGVGKLFDAPNKEETDTNNDTNLLASTVAPPALSPPPSAPLSILPASVSSNSLSSLPQPLSPPPLPPIAPNSAPNSAPAGRKRSHAEISTAGSGIVPPAETSLPTQKQMTLATLSKLFPRSVQARIARMTDKDMVLLPEAELIKDAEISSEYKAVSVTGACLKEVCQAIKPTDPHGIKLIAVKLLASELDLQLNSADGTPLVSAIGGASFFSTYSKQETEALEALI